MATLHDIQVPAMMFIDSAMAILLTAITLYAISRIGIREHTAPVDLLFVCSGIMVIAFAVQIAGRYYFFSHIGFGYPDQAAAALFLGIVQLFFQISIFFPRWEKKFPTWIVVLSAVPGLAVIGLAIIPDILIDNAPAAVQARNHTGEFFIIYFTCFIIYAIGTMLVPIFKSLRLENRSYKTDIIHIALWNGIAALIILITVFLMPIALGIESFRDTGAMAGFLIAMMTIHQGLSGQSMRGFSRAMLQWLLFAAILLTPLVCGLYAYYHLFEYKNDVPLAALAMVSGLYSTLTVTVIRPMIFRIFNRAAQTALLAVDALFRDLTFQPANDADEENFWESFFSNAINRLEGIFDITRASLYIHNAGQKKFFYSYSFGEKIRLGDIDEDNDIVVCAAATGMLHRSLLFTDPRCLPYRHRLVRLFDEAGVELIVPCFDRNRKLIGLLALGKSKNRLFSADLLPALDRFRSRFQEILESYYLLDSIKADQKRLYDLSVILAIRQRIIPAGLAQVAGIRTSSLYMNSETGITNYFDSRIIGNGIAAFIMADMDGGGPDFAIVGLELQAIFQSADISPEDPGELLTLMNWVLSGSGYRERTARSFAFVYDGTSRRIAYSNAAFNPLIYYDDAAENFMELDTEGVPLGMERSFRFHNRSIDAGQRSIGLLYSHGLVSMKNSRGEGYPVSRLKNIIRANKGESPAIMVREASADIGAFLKDSAQTADISLLIFKLS